MNQTPVPEPTVMPVDSASWREELNLPNFVNAFYQYRDIRSCGEVRNVLIIGPGQGLDAAVLRWKGYSVTTFDIDAVLGPDIVGSVHDLSMFGDAQFDIVTVSHVLEHVAVPYLDTAISEVARIARFALVYLPVHGRHIQLKVAPGFGDINLSYVFDLFNYFHKPDGVTPRYMAGQHCWEIGMRGFRLRDVKRRLSRHVTILRSYRNQDWSLSYNFVLRSTRYDRAL